MFLDDKIFLMYCRVRKHATHSLSSSLTTRRRTVCSSRDHKKLKVLRVGKSQFGAYIACTVSGIYGGQWFTPEVGKMYE